MPTKIALSESEAERLITDKRAATLVHMKGNQKMDVKQILASAMALVNERGVEYGSGIEENFERAAQLASLKLNKHVTAYEIAIMLESVKDSRRATSPDHYDSHIDGINYRAFALALSGAQPDVPSTRHMANVIKHGIKGDE